LKVQDVLFQTLLDCYISDKTALNTTNTQADITLHLLSQMVPATYIQDAVAPQLLESQHPKTQAILRFLANLVKTYWEMEKGDEIIDQTDSLVHPISLVSPYSLMTLYFSA
jgi:hypothetical protein